MGTSAIDLSAGLETAEQSPSPQGIDLSAGIDLSSGIESEQPEAVAGATPGTPTPMSVAGSGLRAASNARPVEKNTDQGFLESLGHTFGVGAEEAEQRKQNLTQHPVRTILEDQPPVQAAESLYQGAKRIGGEINQAYQAGKQGNAPGAAVHGIQALPFIGAGIQRGAEQLPAQQGVQNPFTPGVLGTVAGTAAQVAPMALGGFEGFRNAIAKRMGVQTAPAATPAAQPAAASPAAALGELPGSPEGPGGPSGPSDPSTPGRPSAGGPRPLAQPPGTEVGHDGKITLTTEANGVLDDVVANTEARDAAMRKTVDGMGITDVQALRDRIVAKAQQAFTRGQHGPAAEAAADSVLLDRIIHEMGDTETPAGNVEGLSPEETASLFPNTLGRGPEPPPPAPAPPMPTDPAAQVAREQAQTAAAAMADADAMDAAAKNLAAGIPPPKPPMPEGMDKGQLTPEVAQKIAQAIAAAPPEKQGEALKDAHQQLAQWMAQHGTVQGPDGQITMVKNPEQAQQTAAKWINDELSRRQKAQEDAQKAQEKETADAKKAQAKAQKEAQKQSEKQQKEREKAGEPTVEQRAKTLLDSYPERDPVAVLQRNLGLGYSQAKDLADRVRQNAPIEAAPKVGGEGHEVIEEARATVDKQVEALKAGTIKAVHIPEGSKYVPQIPDGMKAVDVKTGPGSGRFIYDPQQIRAATIKEAAKAGTHGDLLGHIQTKQEIAHTENPVIVQARDQDGTVIQDSAVDGANQGAVQAQAESLQERHPDAHISVVQPHEALNERIETAKNEGPDLTAGLEDVPQEQPSVTENQSRPAVKVEPAPAKPAAEASGSGPATPEVAGGSEQPAIKAGDRVTYKTNKGKDREAKVVRITGSDAFIRDGDSTVRKPLADLKAAEPTADEVKPKSNRDRFLEVYERNLLKQVQAKPDEYRYKAEDVPTIAAKMTDALAKGSANKDSVAIRASLKELGVEDTYSAIKKFFAIKGEPAPPKFSRTAHESRFGSETPKPQSLSAQGVEATMEASRKQGDQRPEPEQRKNAENDISANREQMRQGLSGVGEASAREIAEANPHVQMLVDELYPPQPASKQGDANEQPTQNSGTPGEGTEAVAEGPGSVPEDTGTESEGGRRGLPEPLHGASPGKRPESSIRDVQAERTAVGEKEHKYKFGNTQHNISPESDAAKAIDEVRASIPEGDLAGDGKDIDGNHVTVRYGIQGEDTAGIKAFIEQQAPFDATLGPVAKFPPSEHSDGAAPLIAPVESPDLHKLNAEIEKHGDFTEPSFPEYKPHATIAYVKPEAADKYVGDTTTEGATFRVDSIDITDRDGNSETVALKGKQADNVGEEAPNERPAAEGKRPASGGRPTPDTGSSDRERVEPVSAEVHEGPESEGNAPEPDTGNGPVVRSGSGRVSKPRPRRGSGTGSDSSLDQSPSRPVVEEAEQQARKPQKRNTGWFEHPEDWHPPGGALTRLDNNIAALEILRAVEKSPRKITDEEKTKLANYVGWGALSRVFDENYLKQSEEEEHPEDYATTAGYDYNQRRWLDARKETPAYKSERERWRKANKKLRDLLTPDEYNEAKDSTINAHYTSPELVRFMWDAVKRMGFKSGNVLEPSMGVGNFLGMMPPEIRSKVQAVGNDKDTVTTGIAKLLYPEAAIYNKPFEDLILPNNEMDLAISNVPFFEVPVYDRNYPKMKAMLHDYFFVKSMDKVKPGGLVAFITSTGTMDRQRSDIREALAAQGDLVTAFRLPSTAFKANAGTDVTTDLIILRKRIPGEEPGGEAWMKSIPTKVPLEDDRRKQHELNVNEYYQAHPENLLGTAVASKKMHNNLRYALSKPDRPIEELLKEALERIPKNIIKGAPKPTGVTRADTEAVFAVDESLEYSYQIDGKGNIRQKREGKLIPAQAVLDKAGVKQPTKVERMKGLIHLRDKLNALMFAQRTMPDDEANNATLNKMRAELHSDYSKFVKKYGLTNSSANAVIREDPHWPRLLGLEHYDKAKKSGTLADIFTKRTDWPRQSLTSVSQDPAEALQQILGERGYPDMELMAQLQGKTPKEAAETLIQSRVLFRDPITGEYATKEKYLSGYVRTKLDDAKAAVAQGQHEYKVNVEELEKVQPEWLNITDDPETSISVRLGGTWIPIPALEAFFKETLKSEGTFEYKDGAWTVEASNMMTAQIRNQWATPRVHAVTLLQDSLNLKQTTIYDTDSDGKSYVNSEDTTAARAMQERMRTEFQKWALESKEWKEPLEKAYNYAFNNLAETEYDGSFLTFPGMNPDIKLKSHQVNAVWRIIQEGRALLAHEVGAGKTFEMVAAVMEGKRTGVFKKPMIAVPNHIVDQFRKEFLLLYPGANILVPSEKDFDAKNRQRIMSQIATGDYDCILLPHSQFNLMDISPERQKKTIQGEMDELDETLRGAIAEDPEFKGMTLDEAEAKVGSEKGKRGKNQTVKELVKSRLKFKERLKELSDLKADTAINFDDTGVDALFVDEAHEYKNLKYFTKMQRISGLQQANSKRSFRLLAKLQYLQEVNNGRGVVFATGTPVQNTMAELYTMVKYVAPDVLERAGIKYFDDWAANFGSVITAMELSADGRSFKARSKFARFQNVPELMRMFRAFADVKTAADLNLPRPDLEGGKPIVITVPGSEKLDEVVKDLMERAEAVRGGSVRPDQDNMLKITSEGRKAATDLRLLDKEIKDERESKINVAVSQMLKEYRAGEEGKLTQMAFLDMYRSMDEDENELINLYQDMKRKLVAGGVPADQIAIIGDYKTRAKRQALFDRVNDGDVRILLGSTQKMGSGTNAQKRLKALHHIDLTWRPGDLTQREGRILRQGNTNKSVRIYNYLTERSFDAYMAQTLQSKAEFLSQILSGRSASRTVTDAAADMVLSLEEMKVAASGNPDIKKKYDLEMRLAQLQTVERAFDASKRDARYQVESISGSIATSERTIARLEKAQTAIRKAKGEDGKGYTLDVDGKKFTNRKDAMEYVADMKMPGGPFWMKLNGIDIMVDPTKEATERQIVGDEYKTVKVAAAEYKLSHEDWAHGSPDYTIESILLSVASRLSNIDSAIEQQKRFIKDKEEEKPQFQKLADRKDFPERKELEKTREELKEVEKRLGLGNVNQGSQADKEETAAEVDTSKEPEVEERDDDEDENDEDAEDNDESKPKRPRPDASVGFLGTQYADQILKEAGQAGKKFWDADVAPNVVKLGGGARMAGVHIANVLYPRVGANADAQDILSRARGKLESHLFTLEHLDGGLEKFFDKMSRDAQLAFIDRYKLGVGQPDNRLQQIEQIMRAIDDRSLKAAQQFKPNIAAKENHFRVIWKVIPGGKAAGGKSAQFTGAKRPWQGDKGFMKRATLDTISEGINAGGEPVTTNPWKLFTLAQASIMKFVAAQQAWENAKGLGLRKYVKRGEQAPDGWVKINDRIADVYFPEKALSVDIDSLPVQKIGPKANKKEFVAKEDLETHEVMANPGSWYGEPGFARLLNNYLSEDKIRRTPIGSALMFAKNLTTAIELSLSPFHAIFESLEAVGSQFGLGVQRAWNNGIRLGDGAELTQGLKEIANSVAAPYLLSRTGGNVLRYVENPGQFFQTPRGKVFAKRYPDSVGAMQELFNGGLTWGVQRDFRFDPQKSMMEAAKEGNYVGAALRAIPWINSVMMKPLFEAYIPRLKWGLALGLYSEQLVENAEALANGDTTRTEVARKVVDTVENRFGEMNFNNIYWNNTFKSVLQLAFRSVTWKLGNLRGAGSAIGPEMLNSFRDPLEAFRRDWNNGGGGKGGNNGGGGGGGNGRGSMFHPSNARKYVPRVGMNQGWLLGMLFTTAVIGTVLTKFWNDKWPWEMVAEDREEGYSYPGALGLEVIHPRTGRRNDYTGKPERISLPTGLRDFEHLFRDPSGYVKSSSASWASRAYDTLQNRDVFKNYVYDPNAPEYQKLAEIFAYNAPKPMSLQNLTDHYGPQDAGSKVIRAAGLGSASTSLDYSTAEQKMRSMKQHDPMTPAEVKAREEQHMNPTPKELRKQLKARNLPYVERLFKGLSYAQAREVYNSPDTTEHERQLLHKMMREKRQRYLKQSR